MTTSGTSASCSIIAVSWPLPIGPLVPSATTTTWPSLPRPRSCWMSEMPPMNARDSWASTQNPAALSCSAAPSITESPSASFGIGASSDWLTLGSTATGVTAAAVVVGAASVAGGVGGGATAAVVGAALTVGATVVGAAVVGAAVVVVAPAMVVVVAKGSPVNWS